MARSHTGGVSVTVYRYGNAGPFVYEFSPPWPTQLIPTFLQIDDAMTSADRVVEDVGHKCSAWLWRVGDAVTPRAYERLDKRGDRRRC